MANKKIDKSTKLYAISAIKRGEDVADVASAAGVTTQTVNNWVTRYKAYGEEGLSVQRANVTELRAENARLRAEIASLREQLDVADA